MISVKSNAVPKLTAVGSGYYRTFQDDVQQSQHTTEREAIETALTISIDNPEAVVYYDLYDCIVFENFNFGYMSLKNCDKFKPKSILQRISKKLKKQKS